jgi:hypothetical protein
LSKGTSEFFFLHYFSFLFSKNKTLSLFSSYQKHLRQVAEVLAVVLLLLAVDLEHRDGAMAVDLVPGRVLQAALFQVLEHLVSALEELLWVLILFYF